MSETTLEQQLVKLESESRGAIACEELRPDVDWAYLRGMDCKPRRTAAVAGEMSHA